MEPSFEHRLADGYGKLSARLKEAGDYLVGHPIDAATRSLRSVADESGLAPATFTRLAKALDYENFEALRESMRAQIGRRVTSFASRADALQRAPSEEPGTLLQRNRDAAVANIENLASEIDGAQLDATVARLCHARRVVVMGGLGSTGIAEYSTYMANFLAENWQQAGRMGASLGSALCGLDERDAIFVVTKPPFARASIQAAEMARAQGVFVVVVTDSHTCPALRAAHSGFIVPSDSPNFFSSYVATLFLIETIMAMVARHAGPEATRRIAEVERRNRDLEEVIDGRPA